MYCNLFSAWYCLIVVILLVVMYLTLLPFIGPMRAMGSFGFMGFFGFLPFFWFHTFRNEKYDERDLSFRQRALFHGMVSGVALFFPLNVLLFFSYWSFGSADVTMPASLFTLPSYIALIVGIFYTSVTMIRLYSKGERAVEV